MAPKVSAAREERLEDTDGDLTFVKPDDTKEDYFAPNYVTVSPAFADFVALQQLQS
jgi:hypothetical protein